MDEFNRWGQDHSIIQEGSRRYRFQFLCPPRKSSVLSSLFKNRRHPVLFSSLAMDDSVEQRRGRRFKEESMSREDRSVVDTNYRVPEGAHQ